MLPVSLTWDAPPECPSYSDVLTELERIARVRPGRVLTSLKASAKIERNSEGRYHLQLVTERDGERGEKQLDASTCPPLKRGVTLVLALVLGDGVEVVDDAPNDGASTVPGSAAPTATPPAVALIEKHEPGSGHSDLSHDSAVRWATWLEATGSWGLPAAPSLGSRIGAALGGARWEVMLDVTFLPLATAAHVQGIDASLSAVIGAAGACWRSPFSGWSIAACAAFEAGAVRGSASGAWQNGSATAPWLAARPALALIAPIGGPVKLRLDAGVALAPSPPRFAIRSLGEVAAVPAYVPSLSVGVAFER